MCEKNLDKSLEAVGSDCKDYEYPCLELEHFYKQPGCGVFRLYLSPTRRACLDVFCFSAPDCCRERSKLIAEDLRIPLYEVVNYEC